MGLSITAVCRYSRLGFGAILVGASSVGYMGGKLSYILGENCTDKFILQVLLVTNGQILTTHQGP